jgi:squalene-hopene/tetraprenyl-beta-curcumene cyclase
MKHKINRFLLLLFVSIVFVSCGKNGQSGNDSRGNSSAYSFPISLKNEMSHSLEIAYKFLVAEQFKNGSWKSSPAITSLVLYALVETPGNIQVDKLEDAIKRGFAYLRGFVKKDGGIYENEYRSYTTSVALMAFSAYATKEDKDIIMGAKKYLMSVQFDESDNVDNKNTYYGGIGYESANESRPDLSNTQLALEALKLSDEYELKYKNMFPSDAKDLETADNAEALCWQKALIFLSRCQNSKEVNTMSYRTDDDGGFMYETGKYNSDRSHSYGSMTYAGVKSLLYAKVNKSDVRVKKAIEWIKNNYTLEENPRFGTTSLYYYYDTFAKCLNALGDNFITDAKGNVHDWRGDLTKKLVSIQNADGYWVNSDGRYWENMKELATAYSIIALKFAIKGLNKENIN